MATRPGADLLSDAAVLDALLEMGRHAVSFVYDIDELIHPAAEVALLRDLCRERFTRSGH
ncbi:MAG TPA: hypothetical protein VHV74_18365 [Pseudonocardiaceae bacterium]|nr:hypothetical protein [Pseudonocardiaceae bacterium]